MVFPKEYDHQVVTESHEILRVRQIVLNTWNGNTVHAYITKDIEIRRPAGGRPEAKTYSYRYHANQPDGRSLIRYCSPDDPYEPVKQANHRTFHHRHIFDQNGNEIRIENTEGSGTDWPHVSDFLNEVLQNF